MTRGTDCHSRLHGFAMTKRYVILNAERERIRNSPLKDKRIATHLTAVSPAGSVGDSASQRCPPDTRTAMTGSVKTAYRTPYGNAVLKQTAPERSFRSGAASIYPICCKAPLFGRQTPLYPCWLLDGTFL